MAAFFDDELLPRLGMDLNGDLVAQVSLYNGLCTSLGRDHCPSIDATITLTPLSNGQYYVQYHGDDYPSLQVNQRISDQWQELARRKEHPGFLGPTFLLEARKKADDMRNANPMPPGCLLQ